MEERKEKKEEEKKEEEKKCAYRVYVESSKKRREHIVYIERVGGTLQGQGRAGYLGQGTLYISLE